VGAGIIHALSVLPRRRAGRAKCVEIFNFVKLGENYANKLVNLMFCDRWEAKSRVSAARTTRVYFSPQTCLQ
jgi:hypothetical protein